MLGLQDTISQALQENRYALCLPYCAVLAEDCQHPDPPPNPLVDHIGPPIRGILVVQCLEWRTHDRSMFRSKLQVDENLSEIMKD